MDPTILLSSKQRLEREKGLDVVRRILKDSTQQDTISTLETNVLKLLTKETWESIHGALMAAGSVMEARLGSEEFYMEVQREIPKLLEHDEARVRLSAGEVVGHLCRCCGVQVYTDLQDILISGIRSNLERDTESDSIADPDFDQDERPRSPTSSLILHDTAGWKALETYMIALQQAVVGCGVTFAPFVTSDLLQLVFETLTHTNRFVRETGHKTMGALVKCPGLPESTISALWPAVADHLATGLADNWSQVRMAASIATRDFLIAEDSDSIHQSSPASGFPHLVTLLPPMCLNRYYVAEGVKIYSQETWRRVTGGRGVALVEENLEKVVEFYVSQSQASNHAVREAACACIAELGTKISADRLRPFVAMLTTVLLECFKDDSWPVRDAACLASGNFVSCFPEECRGSLDKLFPLFLANLEDSIPSVRQGAAVALAQLFTAYGSDVEGMIFSAIEDRLPQVSAQPSDAPSSVDHSPAVFGVVRTVEVGRGDIDPAHTDQQMYSCGSLAPKMKRGGCMDSAFHKPAQPWERSEGCVHLLAALSQQPAVSGRVASFLPMLAEATRARHYPQYQAYMEAVLRQLPVIAKALGKRTFKKYLEAFLDPIFHSLSCDSALVKEAGSQCLNSLTQFIGRMIMRGRIEQQNSGWVSVFDRTVV